MRGLKRKGGEQKSTEEMRGKRGREVEEGKEEDDEEEEEDENGERGEEERREKNGEDKSNPEENVTSGAPLVSLSSPGTS